MTEASPPIDQVVGRLHARRYARGLLELASLIFLFLPWLIFLLTHLRIWFSVPLCGTTLWGMILVYRDSSSPRDAFGQEAPRSPGSIRLHYILVSSLLVFLILYSGIAGYADQIGDYVKHNAFLSDFIKYPWPVAYADTGREGIEGPVTYYLLYYLPAAVIGKALGWQAANHFTALWGLLGAGVAVGWFLRIVGKVSVLYALLFFFFGGLDIIAWILLHGGSDIYSLPMNQYLNKYFAGSVDFETLKLLYATHFNIFIWAPHQSLPVWIVMGMLLDSALNRRNQRGLLFVASSLPLWTSFGALGTLPFLLLAVVQNVRSEAKGFLQGIRKTLSFQNTVAAPLLVVVATLFISSNRGGYPHGFIWDYDLSKLWIFLLLFYATEFGIYLLVLLPMIRGRQWASLRPWLWTAVAILSLLPVYHLSRFNDFVMRTSLPSIFVLACCAAWFLRTSKSSRWPRGRLVMIALLVIGAAPGLQLLGEQIVGGLNLGDTANRRIAMHVPSLGVNPSHYFGHDDSFFYRHLSRPLDYQSLSVWDFTGARRPGDWIFPKNTRFTQDGAVVEVDRSHQPVLLYDSAVNASDVGVVMVSWSLSSEATGAAPDMVFFSIRSRRDLRSEYPALWQEADLTVRLQLLGASEPATSFATLRRQESWGDTYDMLGIRIAGPRSNRDQAMQITIHRIEFVE